MASTLRQRWQIHRVEASIDPDGVSVTHRSLWRTQTNRARFEDLLIDPIEFATRDVGIAAVLGIFATVFYFASRSDPALNFFGTAAAISASGFAFWHASPDRRMQIQLSPGPYPVIIYRHRPNAPTIS